MGKDRARSGSGFESVASYSRAARRGQVLCVSGTASLGADGVAEPPGDVGAQTSTALEIAIKAVEELGGCIADVVRTRVYLLNGVDWRAAATAHGEIFRGVDPANTTLFVAGFIPPGCLVEVEVDAVIEGM